MANFSSRCTLWQSRIRMSWFNWHTWAFSPLATTSVNDQLFAEMKQNDKFQKCRSECDTGALAVQSMLERIQFLVGIFWSTPVPLREPILIRMFEFIHLNIDCFDKDDDSWDVLTSALNNYLDTHTSPELSYYKKTLLLKTE